MQKIKVKMALLSVQDQFLDGSYKTVSLDSLVTPEV